MAKMTPPTFPRGVAQLERLGQRLRAARIRRRLTLQDLAARVGISSQTLMKIERGNPTTSMATVLRILQVMNLEKDIDALAADDVLGHKLQDISTGAVRR